MMTANTQPILESLLRAEALMRQNLAGIQALQQTTATLQDTIAQLEGLLAEGGLTAEMAAAIQRVCELAEAEAAALAGKPVQMPLPPVQPTA